MSKNISKEFRKYKVKKNNERMNKLCRPRKYQLQPQQKFLEEYFKSKYAQNGLLVNHKIGAGKTCTAVRICESYKKMRNIVVLLPASLIGNFRDELRSQCADNSYISDKDRELLSELSPKSNKYKDIIKKSNNIINKYYTIYSYHKFVELFEQNKIKLRNTLLVVDEVQNMVSESGLFYKYLKQAIDKSDSKTKIVLLSATPMFDKPVELALTINLLKPRKEMPIGNDFNQTFLKKVGDEYVMKNKDLFKKYISGYISYYLGAPPQTFPKMNLKLVKSKMSEFQFKSYMTSLSADGIHMKGAYKDVDILDLPTDFMLGPRLISNIAFPNKGIGIDGYNSLKGRHLDRKNMKQYSIKFYKILNKIKKSTGPVFVYSNFKDIGGIKSFVKFLEYNGYKNYKINGEGVKRFAVWSGDESSNIREEIKRVFNNYNNYNGSKIKIILGTPSIKEGVSLLRVEQVHIIEPYWNMSRLKQIIGRAIRYCSHKDVKSNKRYVDVFIYMATYPGKKTVDQHIWNMAQEKNKVISQFEHSMKEKAIDCKIFKEHNQYKGDKVINCS
jgi:superfamily II DNA or RNA helicase